MNPIPVKYRMALRALIVGLPFVIATQNVHAACYFTAPQLLHNLFHDPSQGNPFVTVIAHRGWWGKYNSKNKDVPENSNGAIAAASDWCLDAMELDVKMTKDSTHLRTNCLETRQMICAVTGTISMI